MPVYQGGEVGDPWPDLEDLFIIPAKQLDILAHLWAWADKTHVSLQHVEQLGEFVKLGLAQNSSCPRDAGICSNCDRSTPVWSAVHHGAELINKKGPEPFSQPFLPEQDRSRRVKLDKQSRQT